VVVDDGATDGTLRAVEPYRDRDRGLSHESGGAEAAYNRGEAPVRDLIRLRFNPRLHEPAPVAERSARSSESLSRPSSST
jgi:glycosyltransferase involved in cell wall biosynthesis